VKLNYVNNIAINGPNSGGAPAAMVQMGGAGAPQVYHSGNLFDQDVSRLVDLDGPSGPVVSGPAVANQPFNISDYQARPLRQTYIEVLSHAGASHARDHHDHRVIRDVMQRGGFLIDRPSDVGGFGAVDGGTPVVSTSRDGIPDWWKQAHGLNIQQQYHQVDSGDGYVRLINRNSNKVVEVQGASTADGGNIVQFNVGESAFPAWSPDGKKIAFSSSRDGDLEIFVMNRNGTGLSQLTVNSPATRGVMVLDMATCPARSVIRQLPCPLLRPPACPLTPGTSAATLLDSRWNSVPSLQRK
jgi:hypothetical protein